MSHGDMVDGGTSELVSKRGRANEEVEGEGDSKGKEGDGEENGQVGSLDYEEWGSIGAITEGDLGGSHVVDNKELGNKGRGAGKVVLVTVKLNEEEEKAGDSTSNKEIEEVLDVSIQVAG